MIKRTGFVVSVQEYRESDGLVQLYSEHGLETFVLRGLYKATSKQTGIAQLYTQVEYLFEERPSQIQTVRSGRLVESFREYRQDIHWISYLSIASEILLRVNRESPVNLSFDAFSMLFSLQNPIKYLLYFMADILINLGLGANVDECVSCGSPQVSAFSISQGGLVCSRCLKLYHPKIETSSLDVLKQLRYLFKANLAQFTSILDFFTEVNTVFEIVVDYFEFHSGIHLKSWDFYRKVYYNSGIGG